MANRAARATVSLGRDLDNVVTSGPFPPPRGFFPFFQSVAAARSEIEQPPLCRYLMKARPFWTNIWTCEDGIRFLSMIKVESSAVAPLSLVQGYAG